MGERPDRALVGAHVGILHELLIVTGVILLLAIGWSASVVVRGFLTEHRAANHLVVRPLPTSLLRANVFVPTRPRDVGRR